MISAISGFGLMAGAVALLQYYRPREGQETNKKEAAVPKFETLIAILITSGLALGLAMILGSLLN